MNLNTHYSTRIKAFNSEELIDHKGKSLEALIKIAKKNGQKILILTDKEDEVSRFNVRTMKFEPEKVNNKKLNKKRKLHKRKFKYAS